MLDGNNRFKAFITPQEIIQDPFECEKFLTTRLDLPGFVKCKVTSQIIEVALNPPDKIDESYIFAQIDTLLQEIGIILIRATIKQFVANAARTLTASILGGALGSRAGPAGALLGLLAGAAIEKALFDWKDVCECTRDEYGNLSMIDLRGNEI